MMENGCVVIEEAIGLLARDGHGNGCGCCHGDESQNHDDEDNHHGISGLDHGMGKGKGEGKGEKEREKTCGLFGWGRGENIIWRFWMCLGH